MSGLFSLRTLVRTLLIALSIAAGVVLYTVWQIKQDVDEVAARFALDPGPQSTLIYDSKDRLFSALYREHRIPVTLEEMSDPLVAAVLTTEDRRFYDHHGVDSRRIFGSLVANLRRGRIVQGGSTITQQFVRGAFLDRSKTYARKMREAWLAHRLESKYSKRAILQAYLNHVYLGEGYYGVQAAALGYFAKPASALNAAESATIASLINRPSVYGIRRTPVKVRDRRDWVLRQMHQNGHLDAASYGAAIATPVASTLAPLTARADVDPIAVSHGPYFASMVHEFLFEKYGIEKALTGGLRVYTTLDANVQRFAEQSVAKRLAELDKRHSANAPLQAALVAIEPSTGYVRAMVGGRDFQE